MTTPRDDRVLPLARWVAGLVIPFLVAAFVILYVYPEESGRLFAWPIQPRMNAMMLAAAYAGGIWFFTGVLFAKRWHRVKIGFLPVTTFASLLGIATALHWEKFTPGHPSFIAWAGLYFTTPLLVIYTWARNRRREPVAGPDEPRLPGTLRVGLVGIAVVTLAIAGVLFVNPTSLIGSWPWKLSPLTARVLGAMFSLPGVVGLGLAADGRWSAAKLILQSQAFSILLILVAAWRDWASFDDASPWAYAFVGGLGVMWAGIVAMLVVMSLVGSRGAAR